jgi:hypothetical protein
LLWDLVLLRGWRWEVAFLVWSVYISICHGSTRGAAETRGRSGLETRVLPEVFEIRFDLGDNNTGGKPFAPAIFANSLRPL